MTTSQTEKLAFFTHDIPKGGAAFRVLQVTIGKKAGTKATMPDFCKFDIKPR